MNRGFGSALSRNSAKLVGYIVGKDVDDEAAIAKDCG